MVGLTAQQRKWINKAEIPKKIKEGRQDKRKQDKGHRGTQHSDSDSALLAIKAKPSVTNSVPAGYITKVLGHMNLPEFVHGLTNHELPHLCVKEKTKKPAEHRELMD